MKDSFNEPKLSKKIRAIQDKEREHLEKRVVINGKLVRFAQMQYEMQKQKMIKKLIDDNDIAQTNFPLIKELD